MSKGSLQIDVLGTSFAIQAEESSEYLLSLLSYYKNVIEQVNSSIPEKDALKTAILAGIMLCDELYKEKQATHHASIPSQELVEVEKITLQMISSIDEVLL